MATIRLYLRSKKNPTNLYLRFINGRAFDKSIALGIQINPKHWDVEREKIKNVMEVPNRDELNFVLTGLKNAIFNAYNMDFVRGEIIDREWLAKNISEHFNRPKGEVNKVISYDKIYVTDFGNWWCKEKGNIWFKNIQSSHTRERRISMKQKAVDLFKDFEEYKKTRVKLNKIDDDVIQDFIHYLEDECDYVESTIKERIAQIKFILHRAEDEKLSVNTRFSKKFVYKKVVKPVDPYLSEEEIEKIYNYDFSDDKVLDNIRDRFIIGLHTGLRMHDFNKRLNKNHIVDDMIDFITSKTKTHVQIPLHDRIKKILEKRNGDFPRSYSGVLFNFKIKDICEMCGISQPMKGGVRTMESGNRKIYGVYPKHELVTSHICRRSFTTNHFGKVSNATIMSICGWSSEKQMIHYVKTSQAQHAEVLRQYWEGQKSDKSQHTEE